MKISITIDSAYNEPLLEIHTAAVTSEVQRLVDSINTLNVELESSKIATSSLFMITAWKAENAVFLKPSDIMQIYSCNKKIFVKTEDAEYELKYRLYELEDLIEEHTLRQFIRISNTDIVNFDFVRNLDMSITGAICVNFKNNGRAFVSRRYVPKIREKLGITSHKKSSAETVQGEKTDEE